MDKHYDVITFISNHVYFKKEDIEQLILLTLSKLQRYLLKQPFRTQTKLKELEIVY